MTSTNEFVCQKRGDEHNQELRLSKKPKLGKDTLDLGGPTYDDDTAQRMLEEANFRPSDMADEELVQASRYGNLLRTFTYEDPMNYYCRVGDLKMCRYLLANGVSTTSSSKIVAFPLYSAACGGNVSICKWLFEHGAKDDVDRADSVFRPLTAACLHSKSEGHLEVAKWLLLNGALRENESGRLDYWDLQGNLNPHSEELCPGHFHMPKMLLAWAEDTAQTHFSFFIFLCGTVRQKDGDCNLRMFSGHPGIRRCIGDMVGIQHGKKDLDILEQLPALLRRFIKDESWYEKLEPDEVNI